MGCQKVTISIITFNRAEVLKELLGSLKKISYKALEIIVVDNYSEDNTAQMVSADFPGVRLIRLSRNMGVEARNVGIINSAGEVVITLDDDVFGIDDGSIEKIIRLFESSPDLGAICFKVYDYHTKKVSNWCHMQKMEDYRNKEFLTMEITEGAVAFRKEIFSKTDYYNENFFISNEGPDLAYRIFNSGYKVIFSPEIEVLHKTAQEGRKSWRRYYFDTRNHFLLAARNYPFFMALRYLFAKSLITLVYSLRDGFFVYWFKGIVDGFLSIPKAIRERTPMKKSTLRVFKEIKKERPGLLYLINKRWKTRDIRL